MLTIYPPLGSSADEITNTPAGNISATTVQAALNELDSEKALLAGSASQVFSVGTATAAAHALRLDQRQDPNRNAAINGDMSVSQINGTTLVTTGVNTDTYVIDQHIVRAAGAAVTAGQSTDAAGLPVGFLYNLKISGAASNTNVTHKHRIEAKNAARFAGKRIAVSFWIYQDTGADLTGVTVKAFCPTTTADTFSALTQEGSTQTISIANAGTIAKYTAFITMGAANVAKGLEIEIDTAAALLAGKTMYVTGLQIEAVAADTLVGTEFEFVPYEMQLQRAMRYLPCVKGIGGYPGQAISTTHALVTIKFPTNTRVPVTGVTFTSAGDNYITQLLAGGTNTMITAMTISSSSDHSVVVDATAGAVLAEGNSSNMFLPFSGSTIYFTGAQL